LYLRFGIVDKQDPGGKRQGGRNLKKTKTKTKTKIKEEEEEDWRL
jgi:hypothetical protein